MKKMKPPQAPGSPTSFDVARAAGVSRVTVSHVLNNTPGNLVSASTREKVLRAARKLGYQPNSSARALRKGHSDEICALVVGPLRNYLTSEWIGGMQARARELGYALETYPYYLTFSPERRKGMLTEILARHPAGLLGTVSAITPSDVRLAARMAVPACVVLGFEPQTYAPTAIIPAEQSAYLAGMHLIERGHTHIGYLSPRPLDPMQEVAVPRSRLGLESAVGTRDIRLNEIPLENGIEGARVAVDTVLRSPERVTAVYGMSDYVCFHFLRALLERGVRVPEDMGLVGGWDDPFCNLFHPSITSIHFDIPSLGAHMVDVADALVHDKTPDPGWLVPPESQLIVRESS